RDAQAKDYYIVWAPDWVKVAPADFARLGTAVRLSEYEILVGLERGLGPGALRAVNHRIELIKLEPVTPVDWRYDGEAPPTKKDPWIEGAINTITAEEYAAYIKQLQDFRTRCTDTSGCDAARDYIRNFFASQNLKGYLFPFECIIFSGAYYAAPPGKIFITTGFGTFKRTVDAGRAWDAIWANGTDYIKAACWLDGERGFFVGNNNKIAKTVDGGDTWEVRPVDNRYRYYMEEVYFVNADTGWVAGAASAGRNQPSRPLVKKTTDGGATWVDHTIGEDYVVRQFEFFDARRGWAMGSYKATREQTIYYTDDGGATWRKCALPNPRIPLTDIGAVAPRGAWASYGTEYLLRTTDGINWEYLKTGVPGSYKQLEFPDSAHGYAAGSKLIKTTDGGATWHEVTTAPAGPYDFMSFADKDHGVLVGKQADEIYRTADGGLTFHEISGSMDVAAENVIGERLGCERPDEIVIIGGHFDAASDQEPSLVPGAEDNASGTACAMAAARAFRNMSFKRTVRYIAFGAEEMGLIGSKAYAERCAQKGEKIVAVLNADMICYDEEGGARDDYTITYGHSDWLFDYVKGIGELYSNRLIYEAGQSASDHRSFWSVGYDAIGGREGGIGAGEGFDYPYYHTAEDTLDKLHPGLGVRFVRDYAAMLAHLAGVGDYCFEPEPPGKAVTPFARPFAVYPNPYCYATSAGGVSFVGVKSPATVEIYDLAGRRVGREVVAAGRDECVWRPAGPGGEALAPGVYLYRVKGQEQRKAGKIVVAK
ncbi:MAG: M20/M25/M40 family metallo-hydrolase, partial [bacterium]